MTDDEALKRGAEAGYALGLALKDIIEPLKLQIALMAAMAAIGLALESAPADAHCYSVWHYPHPQAGCGAHRSIRYFHHAVAKREVEPPPPAAPPQPSEQDDRSWYVEITKMPNFTDAPDQAAIDKLRKLLPAPPPAPAPQ